MNPEDPAPDPTPADPPAEQEPEKNPFPPEHAHLHDWVKDAEKELRELDEESNRTKAAPKPALKPSWAAVPPVGSATRSPTDIQQAKDTLKANTYQQVEKETQRADPEIRQASRDIAFKQLYKEDIAKLPVTKNSLPQPAAQWNVNTTQVKIMAYAQEAREMRPINAAQQTHAQKARETQPTAATQPVFTDAAQQILPRPDWMAAERSVEAPPVVDAPAPQAPAVEVSSPTTVESDAPTKPVSEPEVSDVNIPDWEPEP